ncbi:Ff.00g010990.m01.CDS01 [Fusarium sp. VM40]|nr:Ff.00g010990.m01.CDS01 [Fusarium sp. VM40]
MNKFIAPSLLLVSGSRAATISPREYRPNEHLMLVDCGIGVLPNGASTSREMAYYSGSYTDGNRKWIHPDMIANLP